MPIRSEKQITKIPSIDACAVRVVDPDRVAAVRVELPPEADIAELAAMFELLADFGRLRLLAALRSGETCVCDLAAACGQAESAVSHALRLLRMARVVTVRRAGRMAYYQLADAHVRVLLDLALSHQDHASRAAVGSVAVR
jgi:DNA-binding transcriptional ArsR family regulator